MKRFLAFSALFPLSLAACSVCFSRNPAEYKVDAGYEIWAWLIVVTAFAVPFALFACGFRLKQYEKIPWIRHVLDAGIMTILWFCSQDIIDSFGAMLIGIIFYIPNTIFRFLQSEAAGIVTNYFVFLLLCWFLGRYRLVRKQSAPLP